MIPAKAVRQFASLIVVLMFGAQTHAETVTLQPTAIGTLEVSYHHIEVSRGTFIEYWWIPFPEHLFHSGNLFVEFDLSTLRAGRKIQRAVLNLDGNGGDLSADLFGYTGDGLVTVADIRNSISGISFNLHAGQGSWKSDATTVVSSILNSRNRFIGFRVSPHTRKIGSASFASRPTLTISY